MDRAERELSPSPSSRSGSGFVVSPYRAFTSSSFATRSSFESVRSGITGRSSYLRILPHVFSSIPVKCYPSTESDTGFDSGHKTPSRATMRSVSLSTLSFGNRPFISRICLVVVALIFLMQVFGEPASLALQGYRHRCRRLPGLSRHAVFVVGGVQEGRVASAGRRRIPPLRREVRVDASCRCPPLPGDRWSHRRRGTSSERRSRERAARSARLPSSRSRVGPLRPERGPSLASPKDGPPTSSIESKSRFGRRLARWSVLPWTWWR